MGKGLHEFYLESARLKGTHTPEEWREMKTAYKGRCVRCGQKPKNRMPLTKDHVIPVSLGGADAITNLQPLCPDCNSKKGSKIIDYRIGKPNTRPEWLQPWAAAMITPQYVKGATE